MFINKFDPVAFQIFTFEIRWYSLAYIFGILLGYLYCKKKLIRDQKVFEKFDDFISYLIIGIILGGRIGYVIIYNPLYYLNNPIEIFMIWQGGMSFHGGVIGIIISSYIFSKKNRVDHYSILDLVSMTAPIGIFLGRVSNYINSELYGKVTEVPWATKFILIDNFNRHPSQIYEAILEGIVLFIILNYFYRKMIFKPGLISSLFLIYYSIFRFICEFFREPDIQIGYVFLGLSMGQFISIIFLMIGLILFLKKNEFKK
tara:strand:+ start:5237 stop:6010 length:774 start_codon:yes stop_codon:yes gene_type:complete